MFIRRVFFVSEEIIGEEYGIGADYDRKTTSHAIAFTTIPYGCRSESKQLEFI
jgi:hypothetical protein